MKLIIAGGRNYRLTPEDFAELDSLYKFYPLITEIVSGGAEGADSDGEAWAKRNGIPVKKFLPDWKNHGQAAGPIRNREMAKYADAVLLFPGGRGTQSIYDEAKRARLEIYDLR